MTQVELANRLVNDCEELLTSRLGELNASSRLHVYHRLIRSHVEGLEDIADECFASIQDSKEINR